MSEVNLIFPHQLFIESPLIKNGFPVYLVEEHLFFNQYRFHQQKIAFHRASMQYYRNYLEQKGMKVNYIEAKNHLSDVRNLIAEFQKQKIKSVHYIHPGDDWLERRTKAQARMSGIALHEHENQLFLNTRDDLKVFFRKEKKKFFQTEFYINQRKKRNILLDKQQVPKGGKWSFDAENRKKYPKDKTPPLANYPQKNAYFHEAKIYTEKHFRENPGQLEENPLYPVDHEGAKTWLNDFLQNRFEEFGPYEDAIVANESILHHSVLSPILNTGLISPHEVVKTAMTFAHQHNIPINSLEGFIRQIIGWREFIRGIYETKGVEQRTKNYWGFERKIPQSFYDGTTGIDPVNITIKKVLKTGYAHHIERLMVLGNFMLLCEFHPDEVYRWFMELFIDAYDWVMVPNVYGMSQFADGGLMATKPYISGSNYLLKMSDYKRGPWQEIWDGLFWRFMHVHRDFFTKNPRLGMLVNTFDKMPGEKQKKHLQTADDFLNSL